MCSAHPEEKKLFPPVEPYRRGVLPIGEGHKMYWEQTGNPEGFPALFLHGGPGAGSAPRDRQFFDPKHYRIILFDQRGAGNSIPYASIFANTTKHLIRDIETLRQHLEIDRWLLFGGSWGATLALAYGVQYPERCAGLVLRGIFLGSKSEIKWFLSKMGYIFPEAARKFYEFLPKNERKDLLENYYEKLVSSNEQIYGPAATAWAAYENACSRLVLTKKTSNAHKKMVNELALSRIEAHYFMANCFFPDNYLLDSICNLRHVPSIIVHGRYDIICPIQIAFNLSERWPEAKLVVIPDAGHSAMEPATRAALVNATEKMKDYV
ncbi:MAG: Proline iminopeptidase [Alphaproteobacteria bacterium MarineAlpha3_Bin5]|nr:prolyl aminopeptidase [Magnetovibrio sp.]PPR78515.1 MAG: Proline iminopeptidase [Alphaproteobacteria bacterium MarineAlpha3_Bin5]